MRKKGSFNIRIKELKIDNDNKKINYELIIISDMLESCRFSDSLYINMSAYNSEKLNMAITEFEKANSKIDLTDLNLKVRLIINSPGMGNLLLNLRVVGNPGLENWN
ncbi:MAG: hypothetical protein IPI23_19355 [Bacteroidetes bacterium]|nr:hypothetical protein [Bacteroidota bacterium]